MAERDFYDVLGVGRGATDDEIKRAYRTLARKLHPDVSDAPDAAEKFAEAQQAYAVLSDKEKRASYDRFGRAGPGGAGWSAQSTQGADVDLGDLSDLFGTFFGNRGGGGRAGGGHPFGGGARTASRARATRRGSDASAVLRIPWMRVVEGGTETVRMRRGSGEERRIEVRVPKGVDDGAKLRVRGEGDPGAGGGSAGDLILTVRVDAHPVLKRKDGKGLDLELDMPLSFAEAALGAGVRVPTATGSATLRVPAGTASGKRLRLRGAGLPDEKGGTGDLYAMVQIVPPAAVGDADAEVLGRLGAGDAGDGPGLRGGAGWPAE